MAFGKTTGSAALVAVVLAALSSAGCGTVDTMVGGGLLDRAAAPDFGVLSGVEWDWHVAHHGHILPVVGWIDLPFSLVLDVVLLPVSVPAELLGGGEETGRREQARGGERAARVRCPSPADPDYRSSSCRRRSHQVFHRPMYSLSR